MPEIFQVNECMLLMKFIKNSNVCEMDAYATHTYTYTTPIGEWLREELPQGTKRK
jgi:hypothetical protein